MLKNRTRYVVFGIIAAISAASLYQFRPGSKVAPREVAPRRDMLERLMDNPKRGTTATGNHKLTIGTKTYVLSPLPDLNKGVKTWGGEVPGLGLFLLTEKSRDENGVFWHVSAFRETLSVEARWDTWAKQLVDPKTEFEKWLEPSEELQRDSYPGPTAIDWPKTIRID